MYSQKGNTINLFCHNYIITDSLKRFGNIFRTPFSRSLGKSDTLRHEIAHYYFIWMDIINDQATWIKAVSYGFSQFN